MREHVLLIGGGGREHAIARALADSECELYACAGNRNPGIAGLAADFESVTETDPEAVVAYAEEVGATIAVVGPEAPLAAGVADAVGLSEREPFGTIGPVTIGTMGETHEPLPTDAIRERLDGFDGAEAGGGTRVLAFGPDRIERVAVVTGSGTDWLDEAVEAGADALITGEGKQQVYHDAREAGVTVYLAGHYATETFGVRSLRSLANDWDVETTYVSHPTGL